VQFGIILECFEDQHVECSGRDLITDGHDIDILCHGGVAPARVAVVWF
jgi:hypothetical protein